MNEIRVCLNCGKQVSLPAWRIRQGFKYCSRSCWAIFTNKNVPKSAECKAKLSASAKARGWIGDKHPGWKGGFTKNSLGYIQNNLAVKLQHRHVMETHLGRALMSNEIVHHKDGNKQNNEINNLEIMTRADHLKHHLAQLLAGRGIYANNEC